MTSGERMVWAVAFNSRLMECGDKVSAAICAAVAVKSARAVALEPHRSRLDDDVCAMVDDMLSNGGDR